MNTGSVYRA